MIPPSPRGQQDGTLPHDDHEAWGVLRDRLARGLTFEDIAIELGVGVDHLLDWANFVYQPERRDHTTTVSPTRAPARKDTPRLNVGFRPTQLAVARRAAEGARATREAQFQ